MVAKPERLRNGIIVGMQDVDSGFYRAKSMGIFRTGTGYEPLEMISILYPPMYHI
jgi:hypothetical protein